MSLVCLVLLALICLHLVKSPQIPRRKRQLLKSDLFLRMTKSKLFDGCGRSGHASATCHFKNSKHFNTGGGAYIDSKFYANLKRDKPDYREPFLPKDFSKPSVPASSSSSSSAKQSNTAQAQKRQSKILASVVCT